MKTVTGRQMFGKVVAIDETKVPTRLSIREGEENRPDIGTSQIVHTDVAGRTSRTDIRPR